MRFKAGLVALVLGLTAQAAVGCVVGEVTDPAELLSADLVVVGRVADGGLVTNAPKARGILRAPRFSLQITQVLKDTAGVLEDRPGTIAVAFSGYPYGEPPELKSRPLRGVLMALEGPLPDERDSAARAELPWPRLFLLKQKTCATPLIYEMDTILGAALYQTLTTDRDPAVEWQILSEFYRVIGNDGLERLRTRRGLVP